MSNIDTITRYAENVYSNITKKVIAKDTLEDYINDPIKFIKKNLSFCLNIHNENISIMTKLNDIYLGNQSILNKTRPNETDINNKVVENHTYRIVEFKKGFMVGNPIEYSINNSNINNDDMSIINKHLISSNKASLDIDKYEDIFKYGVALQLVLPKTTEYDIMDEAPFDIINIEAKDGFCVYSSDVTHKKLFGVVISKQNKNTYYTIYMPKKYLVFKRNGNNFDIVEEQQRLYNYIPLIEYQLNKSRLGVVALGELLQNCINNLSSNEADDIEDFVNAYLVFKNQSFDSEVFKEQYLEFKKQRTLLVSTNDPNKPADVEVLSNELDHSNTNIFYERLITSLYDITATPRSSGNVTSGGDTGQARLLGNGWESAQNQANTDTIYIQQFERELLKAILWIERNVKDSKIDKITLGDISIKFTINMSNNILVKTQALTNLYSIKFPKENALAVVGITNDVDGVANAWKKNEEETEKNKQIINVNQNDLKKNNADLTKQSN